MVQVPPPHTRTASMALGRDAYPAFSYSFLPEVERWLEHMEVRDVTAIYHACHAGYDMQPRRIGDDMFFFVVAGRGEVTVEGRTTPVGAGDCAHFLRGQLHSARTDPRQPMDVMALHYSATVFSSLTVQRIIQFPDVTHHGPHSSMENLLTAACREYAWQPAGFRAGLNALALRLLWDLFRNSPGFRALEPEGDKWRDLNRILPALELMRRDLSQPLGMPSLARHCGLSEAHFRRTFTSAMGLAPLRYLTRLRLEQAAVLLISSDLTIEQVADKVGYQDPSFFAHSFKAAIGISPGRYRNRPTP